MQFSVAWTNFPKILVERAKTSIKCNISAMIVLDNGLLLEKLPEL